jgi:hypothetical protein
MSQETSDVGTLIIQQKKKEADSIRKKRKKERQEGRKNREKNSNNFLWQKITSPNSKKIYIFFCRK